MNNEPATTTSSICSPKFAKVQRHRQRTCSHDLVMPRSCFVIITAKDKSTEMEAHDIHTRGKNYKVKLSPHWLTISFTKGVTDLHSTTRSATPSSPIISTPCNWVSLGKYNPSSK